MTKTLLLTGSKQSGKSSAANFLYGVFLHSQKIIKDFKTDEEGNLIVPTEEDSWGVLDLQNPTQELFMWASRFVYPIVKTYSFADLLKQSCMNLFELTYEQCYGTNKQKNSPTKYKFEDFRKLLTVNDTKKIKDRLDTFMSAREVMQYFGTNIMRSIDNNIWVNKVFAQIEEEKPQYAIITDGRFENEIDIAIKFGCEIIKFDRRLYEDGHYSEKELENVDNSKFGLIIDNTNMDMKEKNMLIYNWLNEKGWFKC